MNSVVAAGENLKLFMFVDDLSAQWCISNTMAVLLYTAVSFIAICFIIIGKQIRHSKRYRAVYMDQETQPDDSEAEDDKLEAERKKEQ